MNISLLYIKIFRRENIIEILLQQKLQEHIPDALVTVKGTLTTAAQ